MNLENNPLSAKNLNKLTSKQFEKLVQGIKVPGTDEKGFSIVTLDNSSFTDGTNFTLLKSLDSIIKFNNQLDMKKLGAFQTKIQELEAKKS
ncbi:33678_t:CDS:1 [Racocetra persica]|uniref:33678_t:CDS:1 n=1 Tax=Racocetra persica TaxID=160502 RepID=A0ACA9PF55_9GLOM|nr:33678_t:CDS:1 [Racocetra persica]